MNRYEKWTLTIAIVGLLVGTIVNSIGVYESMSKADRAQSTANEALSLAKSSFAIANNYSYVEVTNSSRLELRPRDCAPIRSSSNVSCNFAGTFNVSFTIIAPQAGIYNVTMIGVTGIGPFSPHPVFYLDGGEARFANITISTTPAPELVSAVQGGVPISSNQPFKQTVAMEVSGFTLEEPSGLIGHLNFQGQAKLLAMLSFSAFQAPWNNRQRLFIVNVDFLPN